MGAPGTDRACRKPDMRTVVDSAGVPAAAARVATAVMPPTMSTSVPVRCGRQRRERGDGEQRNGCESGCQPRLHR